MSNVVQLFPNKGFKLSHKEEMRQVKSSALFPPDSMTVEEFLGKDYEVISKDWYKQLKERAAREIDSECELIDIKCELGMMTLWDRIFNWRY